MALRGWGGGGGEEEVEERRRWRRGGGGGRREQGYIIELVDSISKDERDVP